MNTAQQVAELTQGAAACTFSGGYAVLDRTGARVLFEPGRIVAQKRNAVGRCVFGEYEYRDGSRLVFRWSETHGGRWSAKA